MTGEDQDGSALSRTRVLQFTALVSTLDRFAMPPMILAIARDLHIPVSDVAGAVGAYFFAYGLMQPVWGLLGARIGAVRLLRFTALLAAVATLASGFATGAASLAILRMVAGAGFSNAFPTALFYAGVTAAPGQRHREITGLMAGVAVGTSAATAGAGLVAATVGWRVAFAVTGAAGLVLWVSLRVLPELPAARSAANGIFAPLLAVFRSAAARTLLVLVAVEGAVLLGTLTFLPAAAEHAGGGTALAGLVTATYGLAVLVVAPAVGRLQRRVPPATFILAGACCTVAGCAFAALSVRPATAVVVCILLGAAWAAMHSTLQTWSTEVVPQAGLAMVSLFAGSLFAGSAVAAVLGGRPAGDGRFDLIFATAAAIAVPLAVGGTIARARWSGGMEQA